MRHLKRQKAPKNWPISRKGTTFVVRPNYNIQGGVPILIILRDILKIAQNRKEVKRALHLEQILLNGKVVREDKNSALLFDVISILPSKEEYRLTLSEKGKFKIEKIKETEAGYKIAKIVDKKILKGKKIQLNLSDGRNFLSDIKCNINDSLLINLKKKKIEKCIPLKEKSKILSFAGKHTGQIGIIKKLKDKIAELEIGEKKVNILIKQIMVIE